MASSEQEQQLKQQSEQQQRQRLPRCFEQKRRKSSLAASGRRSVATMFQHLKLKLCALIFLACLIDRTLADLPANHRMDDSESAANTSNSSSTSTGRHSRQYDAPSPGSYASMTAPGGADSSLTGAYMSASSSNAAGLAAAAAAAANSGAYGSASADLGAYSLPSASAYHEPLSVQHYSRAGYPSAGPYSGPHLGAPSSPASLIPGLGPAGQGLFSSTAFPLMAKGFDLSEIVCTAIAVAIGAVIVGAPFILLYLFVMNQNGGPGLAGAPGGGSISLTGPSSSTNVSGRKKRQTSFPEALFKQLSPLINNEQLAQSFKIFISSMAKYGQT